jgi:hypothetical protein
VGDHLLRPKREPCRVLGRQRQRFVERVGMQRIRAAEDRSQRLKRRPDDVVVRLLRGERHTGGLVWKRSFHERSFFAPKRSRITLPTSARRAVLRDFFEEVAVRVEEERDLRHERVDVEAGLTPHSTYSMPSRSVKASSCSAVDPASRM